MATTITTAIASTVTLAAGYTTITSSGTIRPTSSGGYSARAVRVFSGFTLANAGQIQGSTFATTSGIGIEVFAPGTIINSGQIYGSNAFGAYAIKSSTAGLTVINSGIIGHGSLSAAIVTNQATGVIATGLLTASSVTNAGTIGALVAAGVGSGSLMALVATNAATGVMALNSTTISSGGGIAGQLTNDGSIQSNLGITLRGNGTITNNATGIMRSNAVAVSAPTANGFLYAANQTVINAGLIAGGTGGVNFADVAGGSATLVNTGTISTTSGYAVFFTGLLTTRLVVGAAAAFIGTVKSASTASTLELQAPVGTGTISGIGTSFVGFKTIQIDNGATASQWRLNGSAAGFNGTTISGWDPVDQIDITDQTVASVGFSAGVLSFFDAGHSQIGSVTLSGSLVGITNANQFTLIGDGGAGTVIRQSGLISGTVSGTTGLVNNQTVTVASTGILSGGGFTAVSSAAGVNGTLVNAGQVTATYRGVTLGGPSTVSNLATGTIAASYTGGGTYAVVAAAGAGISNAGRISGVDIGVQLTGAATLSNLAGGVITGAVGLSAAAGSAISNAGSIGGGVGVRLLGLNAVTNLAGGVISGTTGVDAAAGATVINAGTISSVVVRAGAATIDSSGTIQNGFTLAAGVANRVIARSGAVFGGTNSLGSVALNTLELATGATTGSFASLPGNFASFGNIVVDSGASWSMGNTTIAAGTTLTDNGTLTISGTLTVNGAIAQNGSPAIVFNGANNRLILAAGASVSGTLDGGTTPGSVLELGAGTGTLTATVYDFTNIVFDAGAQWTIMDAGSDGVTNRTLTGFNSTDRFDFTSRAGGVLSGGGNNFTLTATNGFFSRFSFGGPLASQYATSMFSVTPDGTGGTNLTAPGLIGTSVSQNRTLSSASIAITASGTMTAANSALAVVQGAAGTANTVLNSGTIAGNAFGVQLLGGGYLINAAGALVSGNRAVVMNGAGSVANTGTIRSTNAYTALDLAAGGIVVNAAAGLITALNGPNGGGIGVRLGAAGAVNNAGTISSANTFSTVLYAGGTVINQAGGVITGVLGVRGVYGSTTLSNAGTITGSNGTAAQLNLFQTNRVIVNAGAVFNGLVNGGNSGAYANLSTLEFTSGASTGTLSGLGSHYINFGNVNIDAGANWALAGNNTIVAGAALINGGTLSGGGAHLAGNAGFANNGTLAATAATALTADGLIGTATSTGITNNAGALISGIIGVRGLYGSTTLVNHGTITGTGGTAVQMNLFQTNRVVVTAGAAFNGTVNGGNTGVYLGNSTLEFASLASTGTISGLGSHYINFGVITVDLGANWALAAGNTIASGAGLINSGTLSGAGLHLAGNAGLTNNGSMTATADVGLTFDGNLGTLTSTGITNNVGALISGTIGVRGLYGSTTLVNHGTITGSGGTAVKLNLFQTNRVVVTAGAIFNGVVDGGNTGAYLGNSTLQFASTATTGTISGLGSHYLNFGNINFDASSKWNLSGSNTNIAGTTLNVGAAASLAVSGTITGAGALINNGIITANSSAFVDFGAVSGSGTIQIGGTSLAQFDGAVAAGQRVQFLNNTGTLVVGTPGSFAASISGMVGGDGIDLRGIAPVGTLLATVGAGNVLTVTSNGTSVATLQLDAAQDFTGHSFQALANAAGTGIQLIEDNIPCFLAGTMIETQTGGVAVEALRAGDMVQTLSGTPRPIVWIGSGRTLITPRNRCDVSPVIIRAGALADNVPVRDLHVTRHHAMLVGDVLVPAEHLINGASVVWDDTGRVIEYYHIELDAHDILIADGAPSESFRDDGAAYRFHNVASRPARDCQDPCRPVVESGPALEAAWRTVAARAGQRHVGLTTDPDLHLLIDGVRLEGKSRDGALYWFDLPAGADRAEIISHTTIPAMDGTRADLRRLGVAVAEITAWRHNAGWDLPLAAAEDGWHAMNDGHRWTKGRAEIRLPARAATSLAIRIIPNLRYRTPPHYQATAARYRGRV